MTDPALQTIRQIAGGVLFPGGFADGDDEAFAHALRLAMAMQTSLTVLTGGNRGGGKRFPIRRRLEEWGVLPPGSEPHDVAKLGFWAWKTRTPEATTRKAVLKYLEQRGVDLLVMATRGRSGLFGTKEPSVEESETAGLFIPPSARGFVDVGTGEVHYRRVLVPAASSPNPQSAVNIVFSLARHFEATEGTLILLHVGKEGSRPAVDLPADTGWTIEWVDKSGDIVNEIVRTAGETEADVVVMTTSGRRGFFESLLGSTVDKVLQRSPCPVLALPAT